MPRLMWTLWISFSSVVVSALPWFGPRETFIATATAEWSPAPTSGLELRELSKRLLYPANFCGVQGPRYDNVYCSSDSSCAWFTDITVVGCCSVGGSCDAVYTSCIDANHPQTTTDPNVFTCTSNSICYKNTYDSGYYQYGCGKTSEGQAVATSWPEINTQLSIVVKRTEYGPMKGASTIEGQATAAASTSTTDPDTISPTETTSRSMVSSVTSRTVFPVPPPTSTSNSPANSSDPTSAPISPTTSSTTSTPDTSVNTQTTTTDLSLLPQSSTHNSPLSTGAIIAIGVLAGVISLIALFICIFFLCIRRRRKSETNTPTPSSPRDRDPSYAASQLIPELEQPLAKDAKGKPIQLYDGVAETKVKSEEGRELLEERRGDGEEVYEIAGDASWPVGVQELHGGGDEVRHKATRLPDS